MMMNTAMDKKLGLLNTMESPLASFFDLLSLPTPLPLSSALLSMSAVPGLPPIPDVLSFPATPVGIMENAPEKGARKE